MGSTSVEPASRTKNAIRMTTTLQTIVCCTTRLGYGREREALLLDRAADGQLLAA